MLFLVNCLGEIYLNLLELILLYLLNSYEKKGFLLKKMLKIKNSKLSIFMNVGFEVVISIVLIYLLQRILLPANINIFIIISLVLSTFNIMTNIFKSRKILMKEYLFSHFSNYASNQIAFQKKIIVINWIVSLFQSLTSIVPFSIFFIIFVNDFTYFKYLIFVNVILLSVNLLVYSFSTRTSFSLFINFLGKVILLTIVFAVVSIFMRIISMSRYYINIYGYKLKVVEVLNDQANMLIFHSSFFSFVKRVSGLYNKYFDYSILMLLGLLLLTISIVVFLRTTKFTDKNYSIYLHKNSFSTINNNHFYTFADYITLKKTSKELPKNPLDLFLTGELFIVIGISLGTISYVHNLFVVLIVMFLQLHLIFKGVISASNHLFSNIFKFEQECKMFNLFHIYRIEKRDILFSKFELLQRVTAFYMLLNLSLFFIVTLFISLKQAIALLILVPFFFLMKKEYVLYSLRTTFDVFSILLRESNPPQIERLTDYKGFSLIAASNNLLSKIFTQFSILGLIIIGMFNFVSGVLWIVVLLILSLMIFIQMFYSNRSYKLFNQHK